MSCFQCSFNFVIFARTVEGCTLFNTFKQFYYLLFKFRVIMVSIEKKHQNKDLDVIVEMDTMESTPDLQTVRLVINAIMTIIRVTKRVYFINMEEQ